MKAALYAMGDKHGENWIAHLPWVMLARRTAFQPDLGTSPAEMTFGMTPRLPPDLIGEPGQPLSSPEAEKLLEGLRQKAARPAVQTSHHGEKQTNWPDLKGVTHVFIKRGKTTPLGPSYDGPFKITEKVGKSCIQVRAGSYANGEPRLELHHWENCKPAHIDKSTPEAERPKLGRKLNPRAPDFFPETKPTGPPNVKPFPKEQTNENIRPQRERKRPVRYCA